LQQMRLALAAEFAQQSTARDDIRRIHRGAGGELDRPVAAAMKNEASNGRWLRT